VERGREGMRRRKVNTGRSVKYKFGSRLEVVSKGSDKFQLIPLPLLNDVALPPSLCYRSNDAIETLRGPSKLKGEECAIRHSFLTGLSGA